MDSTGSTLGEREHRFRELYAATYDDLARFVRRRVHATHVEDVVGDVMLVAWRRLDDIPAERSAARAWLFVTARKTLQNARRREERHEAVGALLREAGERPVSGALPDLVACRVDVAAAWPRLSPGEQEVIALAAWDGLTAPEAAAVLGITATAFRLRLSRARRHLRREVDASPPALATYDAPVSERNPR